MRAFVHLGARRRLKPIAPEMFGTDPPDDCEQPRLKRAAGLIGVPRSVNGNQRFLANVLDFVQVRQASPHEARHKRAYVSKQCVKGLPVSVLSALHQLRASGALLLVGSHCTANWGEDAPRLHLTLFPGESVSNRSFSLFPAPRRRAMIRPQSSGRSGVMRKLGMAFLGLAAAALIFSAPAAAQPVKASDDIAGAIITTHNWRAYQRFMSDGLAALFEGRSFWRLSADVRIEVGPTRSIPLPQRYLQDTERYSSQVRLVRTRDGGYVPSGYVGGLPFPKPLEGDPALRGQRIFWDSYYRYQPRVQWAPTFTYTLDRYGDMTRASEVKTVLSQLAFLSDVDFPRTIADGDGYYFVKYNEQIAPEEGKYSTVLDLVPADPTRLDELYEYVPTLRRSLRLSQAARCAPVFGGDYLIDDEGDGPPGLPQLFQIDYLGEKRILALEHASPAAFDSPGGPAQLDANFYYPGGAGFAPFPKPSMGQWELRDSYVISLRRLPAFARGYCYSRRVMYVDEENYFGAGEMDLYSPSGELFKTQLAFLYPAAIPGTRDVSELLAGPNTGFLINFIDKHLTISPGLKSCVNSDCAKDGYLDVHRYASPEALMKIVQ